MLNAVAYEYRKTLRKKQMNKYTSLLNVDAREMTRGEYDALLQQETPSDVAADTKGYLVVLKTA